jgi:MFS family permease
MAVLGVARFAFGMVLPSMQGALALRYEQVGWVSTSNFAGYLVGAWSSGRLTSRWGPRRVITVALAVLAGSLGAVSLAGGFWPVLLAFVATGLGSGVANVAMVGTISRWFLRSIRGWATGLVVGGIGIMNILLVSVTERTREIGIRMAVGAKRAHILLQFLVEAIILTAMGGMAGVVFGIVGAQLLTRLIGWPTIISSQAIVVAFVFSLAVGIFFGLYPANKASRMNPIEALHYE